MPPRIRTHGIRFEAHTLESLLPILRNIIFSSHPYFIAHPERRTHLTGLSVWLSRSSYALGVKDDKDVIVYKLKEGEDLAHARQGAVLFATDLGLRLLPDQMVGAIALQSGIDEPTQPQPGREIIIYYHQVCAFGPVGEIRGVMRNLSTGWLRTVFDPRWLRGLDCTLFDAVVKAFSLFGIVRTDLPGLTWGISAASDISHVRRRFLANNPDLIAGLNQTEYPERFNRMSRRQLIELRQKTLRRMTEDNMGLWRLNSYDYAPTFKALSLKEIAEKCFPFMTDPIFDCLRLEEGARYVTGQLYDLKRIADAALRSARHSFLTGQRAGQRQVFEGLFSGGWQAAADLKERESLDQLFEALVVKAEKTRRQIHREITKLAGLGNRLTEEGVRADCPTVGRFPPLILEDLLGMSLVEYLDSSFQGR
jgi:hypothetical protein